VAGSGRLTADAVLIAALASGATVEDAAARAKVGATTVYRRLKDADFQQQVRDARGAMLSRAVGDLADATTAAVRTLRQLLDAEGDQVKLGAARAILDQVVRLREHTDIEARLAELESRLSARGADSGWRTMEGRSA
jgi:AcrR family transcriptional regulator